MFLFRPVVRLLCAKTSVRLAAQALRQTTASMSVYARARLRKTSRVGCPSHDHVGFCIAFQSPGRRLTRCVSGQWSLESGAFHEEQAEQVSEPASAPMPALAIEGEQNTAGKSTVITQQGRCLAVELPCSTREEIRGLHTTYARGARRSLHLVA